MAAKSGLVALALYGAPGTGKCVTSITVFGLCCTDIPGDRDSLAYSPVCHPGWNESSVPCREARDR